MKTISNSVKAQLFALYYGQAVAKWINQDTLFAVSSLTFQYDEDVDYLQLRSVSDLTNDESIVVAKTMYSFPDWISKDIPFEVKRFKELSSRDPAETDVSFTAITMGKTTGKYHLKIYDGFGFYLGYETPEMLKSIPLHGYLPVIDYLRSIGIALPFTYLSTNHPITLSVQEQVELGIIKLK